MEELQYILEMHINENLNQIVLSHSRDSEKVSKVKIRPILLKGEMVYQETSYRGTQVFHSNYNFREMVERIVNYMSESFRQCQVDTLSAQITVLVSKKGKVTISEKKKEVSGCEGEEALARKAKDLNHNRTKQYILEEGKPVSFLVGLGVQTPEGKVVKSRYDKFRQINRYLEFIEDVLPELPKGRPLNILDFGCGKSYLTFAMYYYLCELKGYQVNITGLDLKEDVIKHCNKLAEEYDYLNLKFERGDIGTYDGTQEVDMVVTLHACDTATDYALEKAVKWGARVIMAVPCCQHEVNRQIASKELSSLLKYGLIKERIAALVTDAVRANLLEEWGYETQILEFIDMQHTPKNLLIRGVKRHKMRPSKGNDIQATCEFLNISPTLRELLKQE